MTDLITLVSDDLRITISPIGAELRSVLDRRDREWLWQGDPASWPRQAPVLFPIVGRCRDDVFRHDGVSYPMPGHGFAPRASFSPVSRSEGHCELRIASTDATRSVYPFDFEFIVSFTLEGRTLVQEARVTNTGREVMPSSVGFHPGFPWPLPVDGAAARGDHVILFDREEPGPVLRLLPQGLQETDEAVPVVAGRIRLDDGLFAQGAIVFRGVRSRRVWFGIPGQPGIGVDLMDMPDLGIWTRPPARYVCIEPWQGYADPADFDGTLLEKPGIVALAPGASYSRTIRLSFADETPAWAAIERPEPHAASPSSDGGEQT